MPESERIEYKSNWRDEYLKVICAFANALGGVLYIGKDDDGKIVGVKDPKRLLEDIPNKCVQLLGIIPKITSHQSKKSTYLIIKVEQSTVPISFHGLYYVRSGSTNQQLKGGLLQSFLLRKSGKSWDEQEEPYATLRDIDNQTLKDFVNRAITAGRIETSARLDTPGELLRKLNLITPSGKLSRAALICFGKNPEKFFPNIHFKIGRFGTNDADLLYQDVVEGNIFSMPEKIFTILKSKYLVAPIKYKNLQRIEQTPYPESALREAILNAIVHKDYSGTDIQLSIYNNELLLWNDGKLPEELSIEKLFAKHPSLPRNKRIADVFFKSGYIEAWGRGIAKINEALALAGLPGLVVSELAGGIQVKFKVKNQVSHQRKNTTHTNDNVVVNVVDNVVNNVVDNVVDKQLYLLKMLKKNGTLSALQLASMLETTERTIQRYLKQLKDSNKITRIGGAKGGYWKVM